MTRCNDKQSQCGVQFFNGISFAFQDINECTVKSHRCDVNAACQNTEGSHECICKTGFEGDGEKCSRKKIILSF